MTRKEKLDLSALLKHVEKHDMEIIKEGITELLQISNALEDEKLNPKLKNLLKNYVFIRLVSIIENYFRECVRVHIDNYNFEFKGLLSNDEIKISILDLQEIKKSERATAGRIIANAYNFQNLEEIDSVLSRLLGRSFFAEVNNRVQRYKFATKQVDYLFDWKELSEIFTIRHDIVHRMKNVEERDNDKILNFVLHAILFCITSTIILIEEIISRIKEGKIKKKIDLDGLNDELKKLENQLL